MKEWKSFKKEEVVNDKKCRYMLRMEKSIL